MLFTNLLKLKLFSIKDFKNEVLDTCHLTFPTWKLFHFYFSHSLECEIIVFLLGVEDVNKKKKEKKEIK